MPAVNGHAIGLKVEQIVARTIREGLPGAKTVVAGSDQTESGHVPGTADEYYVARVTPEGVGAVTPSGPAFLVSVEVLRLAHYTYDAAHSARIYAVEALTNLFGPLASPVVHAAEKVQIDQWFFDDAGVPADADSGMVIDMLMLTIACQALTITDEEMPTTTIANGSLTPAFEYNQSAPSIAMRCELADGGLARVGDDTTQFSAGRAGQTVTLAVVLPGASGGSVTLSASTPFPGVGAVYGVRLELTGEVVFAVAYSGEASIIGEPPNRFVEGVGVLSFPARPVVRETGRAAIREAYLGEAVITTRDDWLWRLAEATTTETVPAAELVRPVTATFSDITENSFSLVTITPRDAYGRATAGVVVIYLESTSGGNTFGLSFESFDQEGFGLLILRQEDLGNRCHRLTLQCWGGAFGVPDVLRVNDSQSSLLQSGVDIHLISVCPYVEHSA